MEDMNDSRKDGNISAQLRRYFWILAVFWTVILGISLVWNSKEKNQEILDLARAHARTAYMKDIVYQQWNTQHGGVYVPVAKKTAPNPYLTDIPEREITTPSGKLLTLMNTDYMTRQVHELMEKQQDFLGHITSLDPVRPENAPDPWEAEALEAFEQGADGIIVAG